MLWNSNSAMAGSTNLVVDFGAVPVKWFGVVLEIAEISILGAKIRFEFYLEKNKLSRKSYVQSFRKCHSSTFCA